MEFPIEPGLKLDALNGACCLGVGPSLAENASIAAYLPKGNEPGDMREIIRQASDTRQLNLRNTSVQTVAGIHNFALKRVAGRHVHWLQRGFVYLRQMAENVVEIDGAARIMSMKWADAVAALFDIKAAFPKLLHNFIFLSLTWLGFPSGFIAMPESLYQVNFCYMTTAQGTT